MATARTMAWVAAAAALAGGIVGLLGGVSLYESIGGNGVERRVDEAARYAVLLGTDGHRRTPEAVADEVVAAAQQAIVTAAVGYERVRPPYRQSLDHALAAFADDPRFADDDTGIMARYARAAFDCRADADVGACTRAATEAIRDQMIRDLQCPPDAPACALPLREGTAYVANAPR